jgi:hypothetical protein
MSDFVIFLLAQSKKNFGLRFSMIVRCITVNIQNYFSDFLITNKRFLIFLKNGESTEAREAKALFACLHVIVPGESLCWSVKKI